MNEKIKTTYCELLMLGGAGSLVTGTAVSEMFDSLSKGNYLYAGLFSGLAIMGAFGASVGLKGAYEIFKASNEKIQKLEKELSELKK
jgi:hypothetical protein